MNFARPRMGGLIGSAAIVAGILGTAARGDDRIDFGRDVRPILRSKCLACHGPDASKAGLRLDNGGDALKGGESGPAIVAGKAVESDLIDRVSHPDPTQRMPPKGDPLTAAEVDILKRWIDQGATWSTDSAHSPADPATHWAFKAPVRPAEPSVSDKKWSRTPIDRFVLAKLEQEGLKPSPEADKSTLLRRLSLDLIGLPPTIAEIDAFLGDSSPEAYEKVVDRLLASPHYGERWGQHWLDAARYADSDGYEKDKPRFIWFFRDWVINALNRDLPYNQFLVEQLAGDLLPHPTQDQVVATGFLRNSLVNEEGGIDPEQFRMEAMFDRVDAIGKGMLGLTIQCAQCHNHKYDPISQEEYYKLFAFLNNDDEPAVLAYTPDQLQQIAQIHRETREIEDGLRHTTPDWPAKLAEWEKSVQPRPVTWNVLQGVFDDLSTGGQKYKPLPDGSFLACGYAPTKLTAKFAVKTDQKVLGAFRMELLNDGNLPANGPGRSLFGTCALTEIEIWAAPLEKPLEAVRLKIASATSDFDQPEKPLEPNFDDRSGKKKVTGSIALAIDDKPETAWGIDAGPGRRNVPRQAVFIPEKPVNNPSGSLITFVFNQNHGGWNSDDLQTNNLGRFRMATTETADVAADPLPPAVREAIAVPVDQRSPAQIAALFASFRLQRPEWREANARIDALWKNYPVGTTSLALQARETPRETMILKRGDFLKPTRPVAAGTPAFLPPLPEGADGSRLTLARWLVDRKAPTTARVLVNRVWQRYFGTGIVATSEDFGLQSERPSHPELLDWLAVEFMERGWSMKDLHKQVVTSATYRQASRVTPELYNQDPYNRLLARGPRIRVEAEIVRDIQLAASGLLNPAIGGQSVMPPAPAFLFQPPASYAPFPWVEATGLDRYRRGLYVYRRRSTPFPLLTTFDAPDASSACVRRNRSNTPLQALMTLNETTAMEAARAMARRILAQGGSTDADRMAYGFRLATGRVPTASEQGVLQALLAKESRSFADGWANPWEVATGAKDRPKDLPENTTPTQLATYTLACRVLLNLDETITKE